MDKSQTTTIESFFIEYRLLLSIPVLLVVAMITCCLLWPKRLDVAARRKKTDERTPDIDDKTKPGKRTKAKTVRFTESPPEESSRDDTQEQISRLEDSETVTQSATTSPQEVPQGSVSEQINVGTLPPMHKDSSRVQEDGPAIDEETTAETGQVIDQIPLANGGKGEGDVPLVNGSEDNSLVNGSEDNPLVNGSEGDVPLANGGVGEPLANGGEGEPLANGCDETREWSFPPSLEDFNLMDTDTDPSELEIIFADERLSEIKLTLEPEGPGLGISIVGGSGSPNGDLPIIIKRILPGSLAEGDGQLKAGDELVAVNETLLVGVRKDYAIDALSSLEGRVRLLVLQDY